MQSFKKFINESKSSDSNKKIEKDLKKLGFRKTDETTSSMGRKVVYEFRYQTSSGERRMIQAVLEGQDSPRFTMFSVERGKRAGSGVRINFDQVKQIIDELNS